MTNYSRGADFENKVKDYLEARDYLVFRAAGSHGLADLVAFSSYGRDSTPWLIQCKIGGRIDPAERIALGQAAAAYELEAVVASRPARGKILFRALRRAQPPAFETIDPDGEPG